MRTFTSVIGLLCSCAIFSATSAVHASPSEESAKPAISQANVENDALRQAEKDGAKLFEAYQRGAEPPEDVATVARASVHDFCPFTYRIFWVDNDAIASVYLIAETKDAEFVWGRHYRIDIDKAGKEVKALTPSTVSCAAMAEPPPGAAPPGSKLAGTGITHLLSKTPTEFHVLISKKTGRPVFVGTSVGIWKVENGKITLMQRRNEQGAPAS